MKPEREADLILEFQKREGKTTEADSSAVKLSYMMQRSGNSLGHDVPLRVHNTEQTHVLNTERSPPGGKYEPTLRPLLKKLEQANNFTQTQNR